MLLGLQTPVRRAAGHPPAILQATVVRITKRLGRGCSVEAAADICEDDPRTADRILERAGRRAQGFRRLHLDELHGRFSTGPAKEGP